MTSYGQRQCNVLLLKVIVIQQHLLSTKLQFSISGVVNGVELVVI